MAPLPDPGSQKPSLQPRLWLIGIALALGIAVGLVMARAAGNTRNPLFQGPWMFGVSAAAQAWFGWALIRAGERPKESILADLARDRLRKVGAVADLEPLLWSAAFVVLTLAGMTSTMFVALALVGA